MKRFFCLLMLLLMAAPALAAEPRYPAENSVVTDAASVFSTAMLDDFRTLDKRLSKADAPQLRIVTVDFLDGQQVQAYAEALFDRWKLDADELLLLLAVGEDAYAIVPGRDVQKLVSAQTLEDLLVTVLRDPFLNQQYEQAAVAFVEAAVREFSRACGKDIRTDDLFGASTTSILGNLANSSTRNDTLENPFQPNESILEPIGTALVIVALMFLVVFLFRKMRRGRPGGNPPKPPRPPQSSRTPQYFRKKEKNRPTPQYFRPRKPRP